jgi:hypothetical protein
VFFIRLPVGARLEEKHLRRKKTAATADQLLASAQLEV